MTKILGKRVKSVHTDSTSANVEFDDGSREKMPLEKYREQLKLGK